MQHEGAERRQQDHLSILTVGSFLFKHKQEGPTVNMLHWHVCRCHTNYTLPYIHTVLTYNILRISYLPHKATKTQRGHMAPQISRLVCVCVCQRCSSQLVQHFSHLPPLQEKQRRGDQRERQVKTKPGEEGELYEESSRRENKRGTFVET